MLQKQAVDKPVLKLLSDLMNVDILQSFALGGGTSLALRLGHRISADIDLFTNEDFNPDMLLQELKKSFDIQLISTAKNTLNTTINTIKTDILAYKYPLLGKVETIDNIRLLSIKDVSAMKLSAVASRGSKKDFYDLYVLLQQFQLKELIAFYELKFSTDQYYHILKSLVYFDDAELEPEPIAVWENLNWNDIKKFFIKLIQNYE
ncbi:MAG: nucleotidyl transferase AbiEii/AbiGii toxin family protein [Calditrichaceae bacterium]|nr:nucleotidyl transferase AbiEii/AbiGii toxin family protein [Calditrichaceae bacterium]MBN2708175.1 nucleotidyl transferase AbiEii/AbiGii toxin family protein [Calditrichaceae bacterium]RQV97173.1 MAG: hypothetical protein EH224_02270 [Calditrichota bacterium]